MNTTTYAETKRGSNPHTLRWLSFAYGVHVAVADQRYDDAILSLRKAPTELMNLLLHQPGLVLTNLFRFITSIICYLPLEDAGAQQFLKVIKSLLRYGATCLPESSASAACGNYSSRHPIRLVLENLAKVEDEQLLMVSRRAWMVACLAAFDLMGELARANANTRWISLAKMRGTSQVPSNQDTVSDRSVKSHVRLATLVNRAFFLRTLAEATGRECSLEDSVLEAFEGPNKATYAPVRQFPSLVLHVLKQNTDCRVYRMRTHGWLCINSLGYLWTTIRAVVWQIFWPPVPSRSNFDHKSASSSVLKCNVVWFSESDLDGHSRESAA